MFLVSFSTASNTAAMSMNMAFAKERLKIEGKFCDFWLPLSHAMFSPSAAAALVAGVFYTAYEAHSLVMQRGNMIFLYTDGVTEAMNEDGEFYSEERLQETLNRQPQKDVREILAVVRQEVRNYAGGAEQSDDITMLGVKFCGIVSK